MKVRLLTNVSDLSGVHHAGDEVEVVDERGAEYIKTGIAEPLSGPKRDDEQKQPELSTPHPPSRPKS